MMSSYRLGSIYYYQGNYADAAREFDSYLVKYPQSDLAFDVTYNLAAAEYQLGRYDHAYTALGRLRAADIQAQGPRRAEVVYQLTAQTAGALSLHSMAVAAYAAQMQLPLDENKRSAIGDSVDSQLARISSAQELERLQAEITEPTTRGRIAARLAALTAPVPVGAGELAQPPGVVEGGAPGVEGQGTMADKLSVGVILPLSGKFSTYGHRALDGILLAAGIYFRNQDSGFRLFIEDSASNPAVAQQAVDRLVNRDKVMAIIGPLNFKESLAVGERAQQLGVLNLTLTGKEGVSSMGPYLFQNALTPRVQLDNLVQYCIGKGMQRFGILAPNNGFGKDMASNFWELTEKYGGHVVAYGTYNPDEKDFQIPIKELVGLANTKYRKLELSKIAEYVKQQKEKTGKEPKSRLPPVVDFDALFIPDAPKTAAQIAASLTYFDVTGVPLLGTTEWNSDQLYKRGGRYVEGAIFPGGVSLGTRSARQKDFIHLYNESYGAAPDLLASQAYEAMELIGASMKKSSNDRNDLVNQLVSLRDFETPLGNVTFDSTRIAKRKLPIFILEAGGNIVEQ